MTKRASASLERRYTTRNMFCTHSARKINILHSRQSGLNRRVFVCFACSQTDFLSVVPVILTPILQPLFLSALVRCVLYRICYSLRYLCISVCAPFCLHIYSIRLFCIFVGSARMNLVMRVQEIVCWVMESSARNRKRCGEN